MEAVLHNTIVSSKFKQPDTEKPISGYKTELAIGIRKQLNLAKFQLKINHDILRGIARIF